MLSMIQDYELQWVRLWKDYTLDRLECLDSQELLNQCLMISSELLKLRQN